MASALSGPPCCPLVHQNTGCSVLKDEVGAQAGKPASGVGQEVERGGCSVAGLQAAPRRCRGMYRLCGWV